MLKCIKNRKFKFSGSLLALRKARKDCFNNLKFLLRHIISYYTYNWNKVTKLNLACGTDHKEGFCNVDLGRSSDVFLDLRNKLPIKDNQIKQIYSSHFVEHLTYSELLFHFKECYRVLEVGGEYSICVPDFVKGLKDYLNKNFEHYKLLDKMFPWDLEDKREKLPADYLDRSLHEFGIHLQFLDFDKIKAMMVSAGFSEDKISLREYDSQIDLQERKDFSIFISAKK